MSLHLKCGQHQSEAMADLEFDVYCHARAHAYTHAHANAHVKPMPVPMPMPMPNLTGRVYRYGARNCVFTGVQPWIRLDIYFPRS